MSTPFLPELVLHFCPQHLWLACSVGCKSSQVGACARRLGNPRRSPRTDGFRLRQSYGADEAFEGRAVRHGCSKALRDLWRQTREQVRRKETAFRVDRSLLPPVLTFVTCGGLQWTSVSRSTRRSSIARSPTYVRRFRSSTPLEKSIPSSRGQANWNAELMEPVQAWDRAACGSRRLVERVGCVYVASLAQHPTTGVVKPLGSFLYGNNGCIADRSENYGLRQSVGTRRIDGNTKWSFHTANERVEHRPCFRSRAIRRSCTSCFSRSGS